MPKATRSNRGRRALDSRRTLSTPGLTPAAPAFSVGLSPRELFMQLFRSMGLSATGSRVRAGANCGILGLRPEVVEGSLLRRAGGRCPAQARWILTEVPVAGAKRRAAGGGAGSVRIRWRAGARLEPF